jgi:LPS sulfotransferase NodH
MRKLVICGTPRSGTKYISDLLNEVGIITAHEQIFNLWNSDYNVKMKGNFWPDNIQAVSGYPSTPFVDKLDPKKYAVITQTRNYKDTIESFKRIGILSGDFNRFPKRHYFNFINFHCFKPWLKDIEDYDDRLTEFYYRWYRLSVKRSEFKYSVSHINTNTLIQILDLIQAPEELKDPNHLQKCIDKMADKKKHPWPGVTYYQGYKN